MSIPVYRDSSKPITERVNDLLERMTPEEKAWQLDMYMGCEFVDKMRSTTQMAPDGNFDASKCEKAMGKVGCGVIHDLYPTKPEIANDLQDWFRKETRLGIPPLLVEEALHGFGRPDSTVFPQCIGLGATFDTELVERIGTAIAAEMRAVGVHLSLSPVLCLAREPRWGRSEETFGEDPWLAGQMGRAYCSGMQGDLGPLNVVAEPKHFAGHGSPQGGLNQGPVHIGEREMHEVMLKAFAPSFLESKALGAMCAYHELDGVPCAANGWLLNDLLRGEWGFEGVVISDLSAIRQLYDKHFIAENPRDAICKSLKAGVDIQFYDFDHTVWVESIVKALETGELPPSVLDRAVGRLLALKFRLGLFEKPETDISLHPAWTRCEKHLELSLEAARKSLILLKNEHECLPLTPTLKRAAVIGPSAAVAQLGDYSGIGDGNPSTILESLKTLQPQTEWIYEKGTDIDEGDMECFPSGWLIAPNGQPGLLGAYMAEGSFDSTPALERIDEVIDFNWAIALAAPGLPADNFAVCWTGTLKPDRDITGSLVFVTPDAVRIWIDEKLAIDGWFTSTADASTRSAPISLKAGQSVSLRIEWKKRGGGSVVSLGFREGADGITAAAEAARKAEVAILCLGESNRTCGEGIDRADLNLPGEQADLFRAVLDTGTPVVVVLQNGRPLAIPEIKAGASAIIEAWYPGERGGEAIAEALLGKINPGGRLPVSVPRHVGQLPCTYDRKPSHQGRYVEMDSSPLWTFGYGLSYTRFEYSNLHLSAKTIKAGEALNVDFDLINSGSVAGDEVMQLYLSDPVASVTRPVHWLAACKRIYLESGQTKRISLTVESSEMALWSQDKKWEVESGEFHVQIGGGQDGPLKGTFTIV